MIPTNPRRGDVWLVDFGEPIGHEQGWRRPAVVMSSDHLNDSAASPVIVVPVTSTRWGLPSHVEIETGQSGLAHTSIRQRGRHQVRLTGTAGQPIRAG